MARDGFPHSVQKITPFIALPGGGDHPALHSADDAVSSQPSLGQTCHRSWPAMASRGQMRPDVVSCGQRTRPIVASAQVLPSCMAASTSPARGQLSCSSQCLSAQVTDAMTPTNILLAKSALMFRQWTDASRSLAHSALLCSHVLARSLTRSVLLPSFYFSLSTLPAQRDADTAHCT